MALRMIQIILKGAHTWQTIAGRTLFELAHAPDHPDELSHTRLDVLRRQ
jgi:hypothetical protein